MTTTVMTNRRQHQRVVVSRHGGPDVLQVVTEEIPEPRAGEVRVRVQAAGVSAYDLMFRHSGLLPGTPRPPFTLGEDVVGVVDSEEPDIWDGKETVSWLIAKREPCLPGSDADALPKNKTEEMTRAPMGSSCQNATCLAW